MIMVDMVTKHSRDIVDLLTQLAEPTPQSNNLEERCEAVAIHLKEGGEHVVVVVWKEDEVEVVEETGRRKCKAGVVEKDMEIAIERKGKVDRVGRVTSMEDRRTTNILW